MKNNSIQLALWILVALVACIAIGKYLGKMESDTEHLQISHGQLDTRVGQLEQENTRREARWGSIERFWDKVRRWIPFL